MVEQVSRTGSRAARRLTAATAIAALTLSVFIPLKGALTDSLSLYAAVQPETSRSDVPLDKDSQPSSSESTRVHDDVAELRQLPLLPENSIVRERFKTLTDVYDLQAMNDVGVLLAGRAGIPAEAYRKLEQVLEELNNGEADGYTVDTTYPFATPEISYVLETYLTDVSAEQFEQEFLELSSYFTLRAAWGGDLHAFASHMILQALPQSCERDLSVAHLAAIGTWRWVDQIDSHFERAIDSCPQDPTPRLTRELLRNRRDRR